MSVREKFVEKRKEEMCQKYSVGEVIGEKYTEMCRRVKGLISGKW